jgi:hypothetical protein
VTQTTTVELTDDEARDEAAIAAGAEELAGQVVDAAATVETEAPPAQAGVVSPELQKKLRDAIEDDTEADRNYTAAKEQARACKEELDCRRSFLKLVAREVADALAGKVEAPAQTAMFDDAGNPTDTAVAPTREMDKAQSDASIDVLGLTESLALKLTEAKVLTLGDLKARFDANPEWWFKDIPGVGGERAATIIDAFHEYMGWSADGAVPADSTSEETTGPVE